MSVPFGWLCRSRKTKSAFWILAGYIGSYSVLSVCGQYQDNVSSLNKLGIYCKCVSDLNEWQPAFIMVTHHPGAPGQFRKMSANIPGYCFLPLVLFDQNYIHPTKHI